MGFFSYDGLKGGAGIYVDGDAFCDEDTDYQSTVLGEINNTQVAYLASVPKLRSRGPETDIHAEQSKYNASNLSTN